MNLYLLIGNDFIPLNFIVIQSRKNKILLNISAIRVHKKPAKLSLDYFRWWTVSRHLSSFPTFTTNVVYFEGNICFHTFATKTARCILFFIKTNPLSRVHFKNNNIYFICIAIDGLQVLLLLDKFQIIFVPHWSGKRWFVSVWNGHLILNVFYQQISYSC